MIYQTEKEITGSVNQQNQHECVKPIVFADHIFCHSAEEQEKQKERGVDGVDKGEDPFGYGIRVDGKILNGARADEWLERDVNEE